MAAPRPDTQDFAGASAGNRPLAHYPQHNLHERSDVPCTDARKWPSAMRKKFLIDYLMAHVNHDDLLKGILLIVCSKGLPGALDEEEFALTAATGMQEAAFSTQAFPSAPPHAAPTWASPPLPQDAPTANCNDLFGSSVSPSTEDVPAENSAACNDWSETDEIVKEILGFSATSSLPARVADRHEVAPKPVASAKDVEANIALTNAENIALLQQLMEGSQSSYSTSAPLQQSSNLQAHCSQENDAFIQAVMAENYALRQHLLARDLSAPVSSTDSQQDAGYPAPATQISLRASLADLIPEPSAEPRRCVGPAASRAAYEACQKYLPQYDVPPVSSSGALAWRSA